MGDSEGQTAKPWRWWAAAVQGVGDVMFESDYAPLFPGEGLPPAITVRKWTGIQIEKAPAGHPAPIIMVPIPWIGIGMNVVEPEETGTMQTHPIIHMTPCGFQAVRQLNEMYKPKSKIIKPTMPIPKLDFSNLKGGKD